MSIYIGVSMIIMFLANLIFMDTARTAGLDITIGHLIQMLVMTLLAPITLPLVIILEFTGINLDQVVFRRKA